MTQSEARAKATAAVRGALERGELPRPDAVPCRSCGRPASEYHHHQGYAPEHRLAVVALCRPCHGRAHGTATTGVVARPAGEAHANARLTTAMVEAIRARYRAGGITQRQLAGEYGVGLASLNRVLQGVSYRSSLPPRPVDARRNTIVCARDLELLAELPDGSVDVWAADPPYNNADPFRGGNSTKTKIRGIYAGGHGRGDGHLMPEAAYQDWQVRVLDEWYRTLADDGLAFYVHKPRHKGGEWIHPVEWVKRSRLEVVGAPLWARHGTQNCDPRRFYPTQQVVLILAKRRGARLKNVEKRCDVWSDIAPAGPRKQTGHPCATPPELFRRCLAAVPRPSDGRRLLVADCYAGTGTVGVVARSLGMDYLLGELEPTYVAQMREALAPGVAERAVS